jgi:hypothetical protein
MHLALGAALTASSAGCTPTQATLTPRPYPELQVSAESLNIELNDPRKQTSSDLAFRRPSELYSGAPATLPADLPSDFEDKARQRLDRLVSSGATAFKVSVEIQQIDVTWETFSDGTEARVAAKIRFVVQSPEGYTLQKGVGASEHKLPEEEATPEELTRVVSFVTLDAFDQFWADEDTLSRLNQNIKAYSERRPE